jgi:large subunit ribosomal protein LP1
MIIKIKFKIDFYITTNNFIIPINKMTSTEHLACVYSSLLLHDLKIPVTEKNINALLSSANIKVEPYWPSLFASYVQKVDLDKLINNIGGGATTSTANESVKAGEKKEEKKEAKKEEKKEEKKKEEKKKSEEGNFSK